MSVYNLLSDNIQIEITPHTKRNNLVSQVNYPKINSNEFLKMVKLFMEKKYGVALKNESFMCNDHYEQFPLSNAQKGIMGYVRHYIQPKTIRSDMIRAYVNDAAFRMTLFEKKTGFSLEKFIVIGEDEGVAREYDRGYGHDLADMKIKLYWLSRKCGLRGLN